MSALGLSEGLQWWVSSSLRQQQPMAANCATTTSSTAPFRAEAKFASMTEMGAHCEQAGPGRERRSAPAEKQQMAQG